MDEERKPFESAWYSVSTFFFHNSIPVVLSKRLASPLHKWVTSRAEKCKTIIDVLSYQNSDDMAQALVAYMNAFIEEGHFNGDTLYKLTVQSVNP